jgi:hypothetical protein
MFGLFKKKLVEEKLREQHKNILEESFRLSSINKKLSNQNSFNAEDVI